MGHATGTWRLFVAAYPPAASAEAMVRALREASDAPGPPWPPSREVSVEQMHLTLQFIGERQERELAGVIESVQAPPPESGRSR